MRRVAPGLTSIPTPSPSSPDAAATACANCGAPLAGPYCAQCGQAADDLRKPLRLLASELSHDVFAFDTRFFRTIVPLFFRPGFLTVEYLSGRREPYVPPLRAYIFASVIFFGLVALVGKNMVNVHVDEDPMVQQRASEFASAAMTYLHFFLVPVFAAIVMLLFRGSKRYYIEHLVFAFHCGAFAFLYFTLLGVIVRLLGGPADGEQPPMIDVLALVWFAGLFVYLVLALKRVYGRSLAATTVRTLGVAVLYVIAFFLTTTVVVVIAIMVYQSEWVVPLIPRLEN